MNKRSKRGERAPGFAKHPDYRIDLLPCAKRVRVQFGGETVADSTRVMLMRETAHVPVYYFPPDDVDGTLLAPTRHATFCPFKGDASYWSVTAAGQIAENAVWSYASPFAEVAAVGGYRAFYWDRMDAWFEEDEEVFAHARDPFVRIDVLKSKRRVRVIIGGEAIAETQRAHFLFETGLPVRYYIPPEDVRVALLVPSATRTACPYKGRARYWSVQIGEHVFEDVAWSYPDPTVEASRIKGQVAFYDERVDAIMVD